MDQDEQEKIPMVKQQYELQVQLAEPIAYAASSDPDILYLHEAMKAPDRAQFLKAMECEIKGHKEGNHWVLIPKHQEGAQHDPMTAKSRSGWIIQYVGCPITWASKLQTLTALSTTEAEYVALSMAMRESLPDNLFQRFRDKC